MQKKNFVKIFLISSSLIIYISLSIYLATNRVRSIAKPQYLPITAEIIINNSRIGLEVADTPEAIQAGLMFRPSLPDNRGMLFIFEPPKRVKFWMKNCSLSLDIIFIKEGVVRGVIENAPPCNSEKCAVYDSAITVDSVIELKGGRMDELGLKIGDRVNISRLNIYSAINN